MEQMKKKCSKRGFVNRCISMVFFMKTYSLTGLNFVLNRLRSEF